MVMALHERIEGDKHTRLRYFCSPHHQDSALYPVVAQLERAAGFARDDGTTEKLRKLMPRVGKSRAKHSAPNPPLGTPQN